MTFDFITITSYFAGVFVACSMLFKTRTYKGTMLMRALNLFGSILFIIWAGANSFMEGTATKYLATLITNVCAVCINGYYLIKEYRAHKLEEEHEIL